MDNRIVEVIKEQLKKTDSNKVVFYYGETPYTAKKLLDEFEKESDFSKVMIDEVVKTAVDIFQRVG